MFNFGDKSEVITFRLNPDQLSKVDRLAKLFRTTRSDLLRGMLESAVQAVDVDAMEKKVKGAR